MSLHALTRSILIAASLLTGLGQSIDALAHGVAHAHEAEHREAVAQPDSHAHQRQEPHRGQHQHGELHEHDEQHTHHEPQPHPLALERLELSQPDHGHGHVHAIVDAGLKSRSDLIPCLVAQPRALALSVNVAVEHEPPHAECSASPPARRHTSASPRAPPAR